TDPQGYATSPPPLMSSPPTLLIAVHWASCLERPTVTTKRAAGKLPDGGSAEDATGQEVLGLEGGEVVAAHVAALREEAVGVAEAEAGPVEGDADGAGVGEAWLRAAAGQVLAEDRLGLGREAVALPVHHEAADRLQLGGLVVGEVDVVGDAGAHAGVGREERV